jgi:hypothetical protein
MSGRLEKGKGFLVGLSMATAPVIFSHGSQTVQRLCTGACPGCYACGIGGVPLLLWMAKRHGRGIGIFALLALAFLIIVIEFWRF